MLPTLFRGRVYFRGLCDSQTHVIPLVGDPEGTKFVQDPCLSVLNASCVYLLGGGSGFGSHGGVSVRAGICVLCRVVCVRVLCVVCCVFDKNFGRAFCVK